MKAPAWEADQRSCAGPVVGEADAVREPTEELSCRVEPLKDFYPGGDIRLPV